MGAKALAVAPANLLYRESQQDLFFQHIFQQQTLPLIVTDLGFSAADGSFSPNRIHTLGPVDQVKTLLYAVRHRIKAAGTANLYLGRKAAHQSDIFDDFPCSPVFAQKLG